MSERLRVEFNQWALDGRGAELESHHRGFVEEMVARMRVQPNDRILEIGCGEGWAARMLAGLVPEGSVIGLDVSDEMVYNARAKSASIDNLMFIFGEAGAIPWQESFFTQALCVEAFYYFEDPERALREIFRVMSPGGSVWILNHLSKENELSLRWIPELKIPVQLLSAEEYEKLFEQCGFRGFTHEMIPEEPGGLPSRTLSESEIQRFREMGALLMHAKKPVD